MAELPAWRAGILNAAKVFKRGSVTIESARYSKRRIE